MELDPIPPSARGGDGRYGTLQLLHGPCHDKKTAQDQAVNGTCDKSQTTEAKVSHASARASAPIPRTRALPSSQRYSCYQDKTVARWDARDFAFVSLNNAAITAVIPAAHAQALGTEASFVPTSGTQTYGLDRFWNGGHRHTKKGVAIPALAWLDLTANYAYGLSVA